jgi:diguanylate cyclase (GGDEF)-like protein
VTRPTLTEFAALTAAGSAALGIALVARLGAGDPELVATVGLGLVALWALGVVAAHRAQGAAATAAASRARPDPVTGLLDRAHLRDEADAALAQAARGGPGIAVAIVDVDGFREVNDTYGAANGDLLLQLLAQRITAVLRPTDTLVRLGSDEFGVLIGGLEVEAQAEVVAQRLREAVEQPFVLAEHTLALEVAVGLAVAAGTGPPVTELLRRADVALRAAKQRHLVVTYRPDLEEHRGDRLGVIGELRRALDAHELVVHYQPLAELATGRVRAAEALVRWEHPLRGLVGPGDFLPVAERSGLVRPLTYRVIDLVMAQLVTLREHGVAVPIAVNVSAKCLLDPLLPKHLAYRLAQTRLDPALLKPEITETAVMADVERITAVLRELTAQGLALVIDDFGVGESSLAYLRRLPVRALKLDGSFIREIGTDPVTARIVAHTVRLGHELGMQVVAECVETVDQWQRLAAVGCDLAQGYLVSRPLPGDHLLALLRAHAGTATAATAAAATAVRR